MSMTNSDEMQVTPAQHRTPCHDCPWRRKAIPGWLGDTSAPEWIQCAHGEAVIECHTLKSRRGAHHCAGAAIYRANVCKSTRTPQLKLPPDAEQVFASPQEFLTHHTL